MTYDREGLSNPLYAEDIINNLEHQLEIAKKRIVELEQKLEDTIISKEETYSMYYEATTDKIIWKEKYESLKREMENVADFFAKYERRVI